MLILQLWVVSMVLLTSCEGFPADKAVESLQTNANTVRTVATVRQSTLTMTTSATGITSGDNKQSDESVQIMQHSKLFTEFVSFAINGMSTLDVVSALHHGFLSDEPNNGVVSHISSSTSQLNVADDSGKVVSSAHSSSSSSGKNSSTGVDESGSHHSNTSSASSLHSNTSGHHSNTSSHHSNTSSHNSNTSDQSAASKHNCTSGSKCDGPTSSLTDLANSDSSPQNLFLEMMSRGSSGLVVSFDYLNITAKSSEGETTSRKPVRMWGLLPDQMSGKTLYFMVDYYTTASYEAETKLSAREQIDDFEQWKSETMSGGDKLGDGTIGALLGGGFG